MFGRKKSRSLSSRRRVRRGEVGESRGDSAGVSGSSLRLHDVISGHSPCDMHTFSSHQVGAISAF